MHDGVLPVGDNEFHTNDHHKCKANNIIKMTLNCQLFLMKNCLTVFQISVISIFLQFVEDLQVPTVTSVSENTDVAS